MAGTQAVIRRAFDIANSQINERQHVKAENVNDIRPQYFTSFGWERRWQVMLWAI